MSRDRPDAHSREPLGEDGRRRLEPRKPNEADEKVVTESSSGRELSLEEIIHLANRIGLEYVDRRREAERLELLRTSVRARIMNRIETEAGGHVPEARLKRLAEADAEYLALLEQLAACRAEAEKLRIRYDSYRNLFDARRTMISYRKTELKTL